VPVPEDLPVVDHHCHLSPNGEGVEAARRFARAGGTHLFLATQSYRPEPPSTPEGYGEQFATTEALARRVREETGVTVFLVVAPYPVDLLRQAGSLGAAEAGRVQRAAIDLAGRWVEEQRAVALGEVGRPHFPYPPELETVVEDTFRYALEVARDAGCPAVVHCEDLDAEGYRELARLAAAASLPPPRVVKHYARRVVPPDERGGVVASYLARKETVAEAIETDGAWFLETDFLDDPARRGAVLDLATIPRRVESLLAADPRMAERLRVPFVDSVQAVYGVTPGRGDIGRRT
jgi:TatD-related deoxyribonuclease